MQMRVRKDDGRIEVRHSDFPNLIPNDLLVIEGYPLIGVSLDITWQYHAELAAKTYDDGHGGRKPSCMIFDTVEMPEALVEALESRCKS